MSQLLQRHQRIYEALKNQSASKSSACPNRQLIFQSTQLHHYQDELVTSAIQKRSLQINAAPNGKPQQALLTQLQIEHLNLNLLGNLNKMRKPYRPVPHQEIQAQNHINHRQVNDHCLQAGSGSQFLQNPCSKRIFKFESRPINDLTSAISNQLIEGTCQNTMLEPNIRRQETLNQRNCGFAWLIGKKQLQKVKDQDSKQCGKANANGIQKIWLDKIRRRLQLSKSIFVDSVFRNTSHETKHLENGYAKEKAERKFLIQKICSIAVQKRRSTSK